MNALRRGTTQSCGCLQRERTSESNFEDLGGKKFGNLIAVERIGINAKNRKSLWRCHCDCGKDTIVQSDHLLSGNTLSCGCLRVNAGNEVQVYNEENLRVDGVFTPILKSKVRVDNKLGVKGVHEVKRKNTIKYKATIRIKGKDIYLGTYDTIEEAIRARKQGEEIHHKPYLERDSKDE